MRTVELLEQALAVIRKLGYQIREECVGGNGGGICVVHGQKWFFLDPSLDLSEQLDVACEALRDEPAIYNAQLSPELRQVLGIRRSA